MLRLPLIFTFVIVLGGPVAAQEATSATGRYQISPDKDGFVRLDTATGTLTHCKKKENIWRCEVLAEERSDIDRDILSLREEAASLNAELGRLTERLQVIEESLGAADNGQPAAPDPMSANRETADDQTRPLAERIMQRLFDMIRELKSEEPAQHI